MDWKYEAREKLMDYEAKRQALENIPTEIRRLELEYGSIRSGMRDSTPVHGGGSRQEDAMLTNIVRREELARQLENSRGWVELVEKALSILDERERMVLDRLYIHRQRGAVQRLAEEFCIEKSSVYRQRDKALRHFALALYGGLES